MVIAFSSSSLAFRVKVYELENNILKVFGGVFMNGMSLKQMLMAAISIKFGANKLKKNMFLIGANLFDALH